MAHRTQKITPFKVITGGTALALLLVMTLGTVVAVGSATAFEHGITLSDWAAIRFTLFQAFVSAFFSIAIAIPTARALARRQFWGRKIMVALLGAPFLLPAIVGPLWSDF